MIGRIYLLISNESHNSLLPPNIHLFNVCSSDIYWHII
nr:MAG TPA: hypothetical protein [Caudoviricetes sp.]